MPEPIPAVAYYRMSTDRQEASIPDQRQEVQAYAGKRGYRIVREYKDEGISGDDTDKRLGFQRMLKDATDLGDFKAVLCWDQDRFGRFDPLEAGYWIKPLRDADVHLATVAQGRIDWEDFAGRIIYAVQQEAKHAFLRDMSRNVIRGMLAKARQGLWLGGPVPYGFAIADGKLVLGDPSKVEVVAWLFRSYASGEWSLGSLCAELNGRGTPPPSGKGLWHKTAVEKILTRPHYCGDMVWNRRHDGKYHEVNEGEIKPAGRRRRRVMKPASEWIVFPNTHEALIDRGTYEAAQQRLRENQGRSTPKKGGGDFLFTRLLFCAQCGSPMHGIENVQWKKTTRTGKPLPSPKRYSYRRYICGRYNAHGTAGCQCNTIPERQLVRAVVGRLLKDFLNEGNLDKLRSELRRQQEPKPTPTTDTDRLHRQLADLEAKISKGADRLLAAPENLTATLTAKLQEWQGERDRLAALLNAQERPRAKQERDVEGIVEQAIAKLWTLRDRLSEQDPKKLRLVIREMVSGVECWFQQVPYGQKGRMRSELARGLIRLRPDVLVHREVVSGRPLTIV